MLYLTISRSCFFQIVFTLQIQEWLIVVLSICCVLLSAYAYNTHVKLIGERRLLSYYERLMENFKSVSNEILLQNHENFLTIAKETFNKALETDKQEVKSIVAPIKEILTLFDKKVSGIEKDRIDAYSDLRRQIKDLLIFNQEIHKTTNSLSKSLSTPFMSGQWGEMQLKRVVEITGMMPYCDFIEQEQCENSRLRPDMVIKLPGNRCIIVDSKAPIDSYMRAANTGDEIHMDAHAKRIKAHIKSLGQKSYWEQFEYTPEFVLMFLPGESFFSSAIKKDPTLIEYGVTENVIITTPITLIALLKAISFSWQQEAIARNAKKIGETGRAVVISLEKLFNYSKDFEKRIIKNVEEYEKINKFIEKTIVPATNKLKNLGIEINEEKIEVIDVVDTE